MQSLRALRETRWASTQATENLRTFRRDLHDECMRRRADALFELTDAVLIAGLVPSPPHLRASPPCTGGAGAASTRRSRRGGSTIRMCGSCARVTLWPKEARRSTRWTSGRTHQPFRRRPFAPYVERRAELLRTPLRRSSRRREARNRGKRLRLATGSVRNTEILSCCLPIAAGRQVEGIGRLLDGVEASILHLSLVGFALPLCLSQSYDLVPGAPTSGMIPSNNPAHQEIYQTCVMINPIL